MNQERIPRKSNQIFVFSTREAAQRVEKPNVPDYYFNASMTYLKTADIPYNHKYRWLSKNEAAKKGIEFRAIGLNETILRNKTYFISAMIGNCASTPSGRTRLVKYLEKNNYLSLFGGCSKDPTKRNVCKKRDDDCVDRIFEKSYFFLALENSVCMDYITEKYWNRTTLQSVAIMWSRETARNQGIPERSVIYIDDFANLGELLKHLEYLRSNYSAYKEHFSWRNDYMLDKKKESRECELCSYVMKQPQSKMYKDAYETYKEETNCQNNFLERFWKF